MSDEPNNNSHDELVQRLVDGFAALTRLAEHLAKKNENLEQQMKSLQAQVQMLSFATLSYFMMRNNSSRSGATYVAVIEYTIHRLIITMTL